MRRGNEWARFIVAMLWIGIGAVATAAADEISFKVGNVVQKIEGTIVKDELDGVTITKDGGEIRKKRAEILSARYDQMPEEFYDVPGLIEAGDYPSAADIIAAAGERVFRKREALGAKFNLLAQHLLYYRGLLNWKMGDADKANQDLSNILKLMEYPVYYFEVKLTQARMLEEKGDKNSMAQAAERYGLAARDFAALVQKFGLGATGESYVLMAELGALRLKLLPVVNSAMPNQEMIASLDNQLNALVAKYARSPEATRDANRTQRLVWQGQQEWQKLIDMLDKDILEAQLADRQIDLFPLYIDRSNAAFQLKDYRAALLDYLRLWLMYESQSQIQGLVHYRIGLCFKELHDKDWEERAKRHFTFAKGLGTDPYATYAGQELKAMKDTVPPAGEKKDAAPAEEKKETGG